MRTASRLALSAAVLGGGLLVAAPASAQEVCAYPFDCPIDGGDGGPGSGGGGTVVSGGSGGGAETLPFTGGEVTLMALAGTAALSGGIVLVAAGRKRASA